MAMEMARSTRERTKPIQDEDLITSIFHKLPVKSLMRFQCVSKSCYYLFKTPAFINMHLNREAKLSDNGDVKCFLVKDYSSLKTYDCMISLLHVCSKNLQAPFMSSFDISHVIPRLNPYFNIVGSCNGLICLCLPDNDYNILKQYVICNPATRKVRYLSKFYHSKFVHVGFGFNLETSDYIIYSLGTKRQGCTLFELLKIYNFRTDSWKTSTMPEALSHNSDRLIRRRSSVLMSGILHWVLELSEVNFMHTFHLGNESFGKIELPSNSADISLDYKHMLLFKLKESLAAGFWSSPFEPAGSSIFLHVWVMKEYGIKDSWTKVLIVGPFPDASLSVDEASCDANVCSYMETLVPIPSKEEDERNIMKPM